MGLILQSNRYQMYNVHIASVCHLDFVHMHYASVFAKTFLSRKPQKPWNLQLVAVSTKTAFGFSPPAPNFYQPAVT